MTPLRMILLPLLTAFAVCAAPVEPQTVSVPFTSRVKPGAVARDFAHTDSTRAKSFSILTPGHAPATNKVVHYIVTVTVGSGPKKQTFNLVVDTGSSNTWIGAGKVYEPTLTSINTTHRVSVQYGSGSFSGVEYHDKARSGGCATVLQQSIGVSSETSGFEGVDGILGLGPEDLTAGTVENTQQVPTIMQGSVRDLQIPANILGVYFKPGASGALSDLNGELTLGGTDKQKYSGSITYIPLTKNSPYSEYWGITVSSIAYESTQLSGSASAIVDTGSTLTYLPLAAYTTFLQSTDGTDDANAGLASFISKPTGNLVFTMGGTDFSLVPGRYLIPEDQYSNLGLETGKYYAYIGNLGPLVTADDVDFILGMKFLEQYYSVYDTAHKRVGLAPRS